MKQRVYLTFSAQTVRQPLIWRLGHDFDVVTNIRTAEVREHMGLVGLEIEGKTAVVEAALKWLQEQGVHVDPIEQDIVEG